MLKEDIPLALSDSFPITLYSTKYVLPQTEAEFCNPLFLSRILTASDFNQSSLLGLSSSVVEFEGAEVIQWRS